MALKKIDYLLRCKVIFIRNLLKTFDGLNFVLSILPFLYGLA